MYRVYFITYSFLVFIFRKSSFEPKFEPKMYMCTISNPKERVHIYGCNLRYGPHVTSPIIDRIPGTSKDHGGDGTGYRVQVWCMVYGTRYRYLVPVSLADG